MWGMRELIEGEGRQVKEEKGRCSFLEERKEEN